MKGTWRMEIDAETTRNIRLREAEQERLCRLAIGSKSTEQPAWRTSITRFIDQLLSIQHADHSIDPLELKSDIHTRAPSA